MISRFKKHKINMSLRPRLDSYIYQNGEPYLYPMGGMSSYVGDSRRVIKNIPPNNYKSYNLFPQEFSNKPKLSYMFKPENGHFSQKEVPTRKTGNIKWIKSNFIKKAQPKIILPNSVVNMRNQVMSDGYPQNQSLVHQKQSETQKLGVIQKQIEQLELLAQDPRIDPAKQAEFKTEADNLMINYFPNQVMIKQYSQMIDELKNVKDEIVSSGVGGGGGSMGGGFALSPPAKSLLSTDIKFYLSEKDFDQLAEDFKNASEPSSDIEDMQKIADALGMDKTDISKLSKEDLAKEVEDIINNNVGVIQPNILIPFSDIPERDSTIVENLTLHNLEVLENIYTNDYKDWKRSEKDLFIMNYILHKQPYLQDSDVFALRREFQRDSKNWWTRSPTTLKPLLNKFISDKFKNSSS